MHKNISRADKDIKRVAIVGCGNIAAEADNDVKKRHIYSHAKAISMIKQIRFSACCDINKICLAEFARKWKIQRQYLDLREMLRKEQIDILIIATPTESHYENVCLALNSKVKAIFCEKPLTFDFKLGLKLVEKAEKLNKLLLVNYMRRWDKFYFECKNILQSQRLGRIETIVAYVDTALHMNASHMLDMLIYFGGDIFSCTGFIDKTNHPRIVHGKKDFGAIALIKHKNGIISFLKATGESRRNHFFELDIQCTKGRLRILDDDMKYEVYKFKESHQHKGLEELALTYTKFNDNKNERLIMAYFDILKWLKCRKKPGFSAREALKSSELINLIYKSDSIGNLPAYSRLPCSNE